jgi:signal recognition particle receptor subunit beta
MIGTSHSPCLAPLSLLFSSSLFPFPLVPSHFRCIFTFNHRERTEEAKEELHKLLGEAELAGIPVLIFANKQDLSNSLSLAQLTDQLDMHKERSRKWFVQACSATSGMGVYEGLDWLSRAIYP